MITQTLYTPKHHKAIVMDIFADTSKNLQKKPLVIFCHGYKGFKDWGPWNIVANAFAKAGYVFVKFNFSHNGTTPEHPNDFSDLESFGKNTFSLELEDLQTVIDHTTSTDFITKHHINTDKIAVIGHSRGGGIASIKASECAKISHLISWAGVSDFGARFSDTKTIAHWQEQGVIYIENSRTKQKLPHFYEFYQDFIAHKDRLTIKNVVEKLNCKHAIIHGDKDTSVVIEEAKNLHLWNPNSILKIIPNADHSFNSKHPWQKDTLPLALEEVVSYSMAFIQEN